MSIGELNPRRSPYAWTAVALLAAVVAGAQPEWRLRGRESDSISQMPGPECPYHGSVRPPVTDTAGQHVPLSPDSFPVLLSGPIAGIPEYHDCQRFMPNVTFLQWMLSHKRPFFDSLYAIFAAFQLDSVLKVPGLGIPAATIFSFGGTYDPLGIKPGFNCLVFKGGPGHWTAVMLPQANANDGNCTASHININGLGTPLAVIENPPIVFDSSHALFRPKPPPAARWDWDGKQQYIGIACGLLWCEVGPQGFTPSPGYQGPDLTFDDIPGLSVPAGQSQQVTRIKGWYDDQQMDSALANGRHLVTGVHGWVFPNPELNDTILDLPQSVALLQGVWIHVATAVLNGDYKGNLRAGINKIYMCHETKGAKGRCRKHPLPISESVPMGQPPVKPFSRALPQCDKESDGTRRWWKIQPAQGPARFVCGKRRDHYNDLQAYRNANQGVRIWIPGTARWRWMLEDVGEWHKCETGCCTGQ
jgi:hypothetical protein